MEVATFTSTAQAATNSIMQYFVAVVPIVLVVTALVIGLQLMIGLFKWLARSIGS